MSATLRYVTVFIAGYLFTVSALAQTTPPLLHGEVYVKIQNGCGMILNTLNLKPPRNDVEKIKKDMGEMSWSGPCPNGLADGIGVLGKPVDLKKLADYKFEYAYGRQLGKWTNPAFGYAGTQMIYKLGDRIVIVPNIANPFAPRWVDVAIDLEHMAGQKGGRLEEAATSLSDADKNRVSTHQSDCFIDLKAF